jgi:hypothetical protein
VTVNIKMKDELNSFPIKGDLEDLTGHLNIAQAQGRQFVIVPQPDDRPRMIAVHNISYADQVEDDSMSWVG